MILFFFIGYWTYLSHPVMSIEDAISPDLDSASLESGLVKKTVSVLSHLMNHIVINLGVLFKGIL